MKDKKNKVFSGISVVPSLSNFGDFGQDKIPQSPLTLNLITAIHLINQELDENPMKSGYEF